MLTKQAKTPWVELAIHLFILVFFLKFAYTNWLMINHEIAPGGSAGWRTETILAKGEEAWYIANEHAGRIMFIATALGMLSLLAGIAALLKRPSKAGLYAAVSVFVAVGLLALGYAYTSWTLPRVLGSG